ncbi:hypothetical protein [Rickettsia endosymbiont of Gonocerus acuteangulatus]|uniref:hypothetical protein n=1 Tax=Rickettsia endosymbiont of Gonocerus acuteangulatus TaxID=3066266 RepID=UPI003132D64E
MEKDKSEILIGKVFNKSINLVESAIFILDRFSAINNALVISSFQRGGTMNVNLLQ